MQLSNLHKMIFATLCLFAALVAAEDEPQLSIMPVPGDVGCPVFTMIAPEPGCHYEYEKDENGCDTNPHQVCDDGEKIPCPVYDMTAPEPGCRWEFDQDENGCDTNPHQVCDGEEGGDSCPPMPPMAPPPEGCDYEFQTDENGCMVNPVLVCSGETTPNPNCPMFRLVAPEPGCHYEYDMDDNGCRTNPHQVCDVEEIPCPMYSLIAPEPGCHWEFEQNENGCDTNPHQVCDEGFSGEIDPPMPTSCAAVSCMVGSDCQVIDGVAQCVNVDSGNSTSSKCAENEEMKTCGSACPETCEQVRTGVYPLCIRKCVLNVCQCKQGYALDSDGKCVPREQCHRSEGGPTDECGPNEELKECGTMCPTTCEQITNNEMVPCIEMCQLNVCQCKEGFALDGEGSCVAITDCPNNNNGKGKGRRGDRKFNRGPVLRGQRRH